jgi:hypothetical protein
MLAARAKCAQIVILCLCPALWAQTDPRSIGDAWDQVLPRTVSLASPPASMPKGFADDLLNHLFFEARTDYYRYSTAFTGDLSNTGVMNVSNNGIFNPNGIPYPDAFQPTANRIESFLDFGTRGWVSSRVTTHFAFRYYQDITHVVPGAPAENIVEAAASNRSIQFLTGSVEIDGKSGTSLTIGRQNVYGAELAQIDGADFTVDRAAYRFTIYGGRRFSLFSDPNQRALVGGGIDFKLGRDTSVELQTMWYIKGSNRAAFRYRFNRRWRFQSGFRAYGGSPVDLSAEGIYSGREGKTSLRLGVLQKLSSNDYTYDYTESAKDLNPNSPLLRLYLGQTAPYTQLRLDARRTLIGSLSAGAAIWVRQLNSSSNTGPYDTSFQDYKAQAQYFPARKLETYFEYHQRNSARLNPSNATSFADINMAGETSVKDMTGEIRRGFGDGRFNLSGGVYYRRISIQDRFYRIDNQHQSGWLGSAWVRLDSRTRVFTDYSLDNSFFLFSPDLKNSRTLRLGVAWKY